MSRLSPAVSGSLKPLLLTGALAGTLLVAACGPKPAATPAAAPPPPPAAPVTADAATRAAIQQTLSYSGDIRAREQVSVLPKVSGRVGKVLVERRTWIPTRTDKKCRMIAVAIILQPLEPW